MKNSVILTLVIALLMIGTSVSATGFVVKPNANFKSVASTTIKKDSRKVFKKVTRSLKSESEKKDEVAYVSCCMTSKIEYTDSEGFCCRSLQVTVCDNNCATASQRANALLAILLFMGF